MSRHCLSPIACCLMFLFSTPAWTRTGSHTQTRVATFLHFDEWTDGWSISEEYAAQGVHFVNDFSTAVVFQADPRAATHPNAHTPPNVLVNHAQDTEVYSSGNVVLAARFDQPMKGVGMWLGTEAACLGGATATVRLYDCAGNQVGTSSAAVSSAFSTPMEVLDPDGQVRLLVVDYGSTTCAEAIDELAFEPSGETGCVDSTPPIVDVSSHSNDQVLIEPVAVLEGTVTENSGALLTVKVNGQVAAHHLMSGTPLKYRFRHRLNLHEGANPITIYALDAAGKKGTRSLTLHYTPPATATLKQFHLTQRGILQNQACDIDTPFVAGKSAMVRAHVEARTATNALSTFSSLQLTLKRQTARGFEVVDTFYDTTYSYLLTGQTAAASLTGSHFLIPGDKLDPAGTYSFELQPYVGLNPLGPVLTPSCGGNAYTFSETRPVRLSILPVEASSSDSNQEPDHIQNFGAQLNAISRIFPVRDGALETWWNQPAGVLYVEQPPLRLCDGSEAMHQAFSNYCKGTGYAWRFVDHDASGVMRRSNHAVVIDNNASTCDPKNKAIGGRELTTACDGCTRTFLPELGYFRGGAHPGDWSKYYLFFDEDHDGDIDASDRQYFIAELFDAQTSKWTTDLSKYDVGETYRYFVDQNGNNCNDADSNGTLLEPQAQIIRLWQNATNVVFGPALDAMNNHNKLMPGTDHDLDYASLWFPTVVAPYSAAWGTWGPGSSRPTNESWIRVQNDQSIAHELGHNIGDLHDVYTDTACQSAASRENVWAAYIGLQSVAPASIFDLMACSTNPDVIFPKKSNYQTLFDKLVVSSIREPSRVTGPMLLVTGSLKPNGTIERLNYDVGADLPMPPEPDATLYLLVVGQGGMRLVEQPFAVHSGEAPPEGFPAWPAPRRFQVVAPFPAGATWFELWNGSQWLGRWNASATAPQVHLVTPNGGQSYGAGDRVTAQWTASDADGDLLVARVLYSHDGGTNWRQVASGLTGTQAVVDFAALPGTTGASGLLKVIVSDGFRSAEDSSDLAFTVAHKPPSAAIIEPRSDQLFLQCEQFQARGVGRDVDGPVPLLIWTIDGGAAVGLGSPVQLGPLTPGAHLIELHVFDGGFEQSVAVKTVQVLEDSDCDGMTDNYEEVNGLEPGWAEDALQDADGDGQTNLVEATLGQSSADADTDDDGLSDTAEDVDGNGSWGPAETNAVNADTDGDGLQDGTEKGITAAGSGTDLGVFQPDLDPASRTNAINPDTDSDGLLDGTEDANHNGRVDPGETDPNVPNFPGPTVPLRLMGLGLLLVPCAIGLRRARRSGGLARPGSAR